MAVTGAHLITNSSTSNATSYTTASMTPLANRLVLAFVLSAKTAAPSPLVPTLTGNSLTWVQVATVTFATVATGLYRLTLFRGMGASPTQGRWPSASARSRSRAAPGRLVNMMGWRPGAPMAPRRLGR